MTLATPAPLAPFEKGRGVSFTPPALAEDLARALLEHWTPPQGVLDPACGDGALLEAAWRTGRARGLRAERIFGFEVDAELAERARARMRALIPGEDGERLARHVITTDALRSEAAWPPGTLILANPPWVSFSGRQAASGRSRAKRAGAGWPSLHGAFLERIARHVATEGTHAALLLPAPVLDGESYGPLRRAVTELVELAAPVRELGESRFPGVVEPACVLQLGARARKGPGSSAAWLAPAPFEAAVERMRRFAPLPPQCFGDLGVHSGNAARELIVRSGHPDLPGIREGRDLAPYRLGAPRLRLNVGLERTPELRFRCGSLERYRSIPILLRQTADRPIAALHTAPTYFRNSLLACTPPAGLAPAFVVAALNSTLAGAWHRASFRDARQRTFPQVKIAHLRALPMPIRERDEAPDLHDRVVAHVRAGEYAHADRLIEEAYGVRTKSAATDGRTESGQNPPPLALPGRCVT